MECLSSNMWFRQLNESVKGMKADKCIIIAEAGVNHNGNLDTAIRLCDAAKKAGADIIKFQTWKTENIITKNVKQAEYQEKNTGLCESQFDMLKRLELSYEKFGIIKEHCDNIGIRFASTADDMESLDFLISLGIPFIKVASGDIGNIPYLRYIGSKNRSIVLSTGMSSLTDVKRSVETLKESGAADITLLHCTTNYPCPFEEVNLKAMLTLEHAFHMPFGYSDHTIGVEVAIAAVAMGAKIIEKHFTLDRNMEGPDHVASTEPGEFSKMVWQIRDVECAMGDGIKQLTDSEKVIKEVVMKRIVASRKIKAGDIFSEENICVKRSNAGKYASEWDKVTGTFALRNYEIDDGID